jgi:hypothetical protein
MVRRKTTTQDLIIVWASVFLVIAVITIPDFYKTVMEAILSLGACFYWLTKIHVPTKKQPPHITTTAKAEKVSPILFWARITLDFANAVVLFLDGQALWNFVSFFGTPIVTYNDLLSIGLAGMGTLFVIDGIRQLWKAYS